MPVGVICTLRLNVVPVKAPQDWSEVFISTSKMRSPNSAMFAVFAPITTSCAAWDALFVVIYAANPPAVVVANASAAYATGPSPPGPAGPVSPLGPAGPVGPPDGPVAPVGPVGPPAGPPGPVGPVSPCAPVGPVAPVGPANAFVTCCTVKIALGVAGRVGPVCGPS